MQAVQEKKTVVSVISLIIASVSTVGIIVIALHQRIQRSPRKQLYIVKSAGIDCVTKCIIIAGILANIGLIVRSIAWICDFSPSEMGGKLYYGTLALCIITSVWIQYFFGSIVFWHLVYGLETFKTIRGKCCPNWVKYLLGWAVPACLCFLTSMLTYYPSLNDCSMRRRNYSVIIDVIILAPTVVVLLVLIILFYKSFHQAKMLLIQNFGQFSTAERQTLEYVQAKFIVIPTVFIICFIPNILNGIFINVIEDKVLTWALLVLMAVLNPSLVVIQLLVMHGWPSGCMGIFKPHHLDINGKSRVLFQESENDPLLSFSRNLRR